MFCQYSEISETEEIIHYSLHFIRLLTDESKPLVASEETSIASLPGGPSRRSGRRSRATRPRGRAPARSPARAVGGPQEPSASR